MQRLSDETGVFPFRILLEKGDRLYIEDITDVFVLTAEGQIFLFSAYTSNDPTLFDVRFEIKPRDPEYAEKLNFAEFIFACDYGQAVA